MSAHQQFDEELALLALGELTGERRLAVERHLDECVDCRREVERVWGDFALLALSAGGPKPPERSRDRLMAAIASEARRTQPVAMAPRDWRKLREWAIAAASVIAISLFLNQSMNLRKQIKDLEAQSAVQQQQLAQAKELMISLASAEAQHFSLTTGKTPPLPQGKVLYVRSSGTLVFLASNLAPLPSEKTYELWLIPAGGAPIPAGLFKPAADGSAAIIKPPLPAGVEAQTFAISIEPEAGSPAPTTQPIMVASKG